LGFAVAPLFSLFLQEIISERRPSAAGILGFRGITDQKNSGDCGTPSGNHRLVDKCAHFKL
jgi:hypothetical protein